MTIVVVVASTVAAVFAVLCVVDVGRGRCGGGLEDVRTGTAVRKDGVVRAAATAAIGRTAGAVHAWGKNKRKY